MPEQPDDSEQFKKGADDEVTEVTDEMIVESTDIETGVTTGENDEFIVKTWGEGALEIIKKPDLLDNALAELDAAGPPTEAISNLPKELVEAKNYQEFFKAAVDKEHKTKLVERLKDQLNESGVSDPDAYLEKLATGGLKVRLEHVARTMVNPTLDSELDNYQTLRDQLEGAEQELPPEDVVRAALAKAEAYKMQGGVTRKSTPISHGSIFSLKI